jgi:hypothetical protein
MWRDSGKNNICQVSEKVSPVKYHNNKIPRGKTGVEV